MYRHQNFKKEAEFFNTSCTAVNIFHSLIKTKIMQGLQMHACRMQMYVTYNYIILYDNIQYAYYTKFYLSVCSTPL